MDTIKQWKYLDIYMIRNKYTHHKEGNISYVNEPSKGYSCSVNFTKYPDMKSCYDTLTPLFGKNFILCNGCENSLRICFQVLSLLGINSLVWATPTWGMVDVFCSMFRFKSIPKQYLYDTVRSTVVSPDLQGECIYDCNGKNNLFSYKKGRMDSVIKIIDTTYTDIVFNDEEYIYIGSLGKKYGCGVRLGYVRFPEKYSELFNLCREQYINSGAEKLILSGLIDNKAPNVFTTLRGHHSNGKVFYLPDYEGNKVCFTRLGNEYCR